MPSGVYIRTEQGRQNMILAQIAVGRIAVPKNCKNTGRTRFKRGDIKLIGNTNGFKKGDIAWNKGTKGVMKGWNKGNFGYHCGELNPNWKGGRTDEEHRLRRTSQWLDWRKKVFEKDDYTCRQCGAKSGENYDGIVYLEPHHRIGVHELFINNFKNYIFNVDNGLTLCKDCHLGVTALQRRTSCQQ